MQEKFFTRADDEFKDEIINDTDPAPKTSAHHQSVNHNFTFKEAEAFDPETGF